METVSKRRKPLSDLTNSITSADYSSVSSSFVKPTKPDPSLLVSSVLKKLLNDIKNETSIRGNDNINLTTSASSNPSKPNSSLRPPHTPAKSRPLKSTSSSGTGNKHEDSEACTVYNKK